jgi:hypothetical protein
MASPRLGLIKSTSRPLGLQYVALTLDVLSSHDISLRTWSACDLCMNLDVWRRNSTNMWILLRHIRSRCLAFMSL